MEYLLSGGNTALRFAPERNLITIKKSMTLTPEELEDLIRAFMRDHGMKRWQAKKMIREFIN